MNTNTNHIEAAAATAVGGSVIAADWFNMLDRGLHFALAVCGLCWWVRLWLKNPNVPPPGSPRSGKWKPPIKLLLLSLLCCYGCASVKVSIFEEKDGTKQTTVRAFTLFDAKSELAKLRTTSTDKTQGVTLSGLVQESNGSNVVNLVESAVSAAVSAAVKSVKP